MTPFEIFSSICSIVTIGVSVWAILYSRNTRKIVNNHIENHTSAKGGNITGATFTNVRAGEGSFGSVTIKE